MRANWRAFALIWIFTGSVAALGATPPPGSPAAMREAEKLDRLPPVPPQPAGRIDPSGRKEEGRASYYSRYFDERTMADGRPMNPKANIAASKTLPLGTMAKVTDIQNGKSVTVKIEDRGPYVKGRVVDLSPAVADKLHIKKQGVAPVIVKPITVPQPDGAVKLGAGAAEVSWKEITRADAETKVLVKDKPAKDANR